MDNQKQFDENFLDDDSFRVKEGKVPFEKVWAELTETKQCKKERSAYVECLQKRMRDCEEMKDNIVACYKNAGKY